ncbi:MAG TPA: PaaI family thioesterase [Gaiellaceae bacterium]|jgi:1,4-dihydroxy-2-naphthoyl-CoA hydrolase|nr:PaaI family thioesterase [Gaiellaceae bacterium]
MSELEASPFDRHYGLEVDEAGEELVRAHVPVVRHVTQPLGLVHGGVYASIAEALASLGTNIGVVPRGRVGLGMSNHSTFLRPISRGTIHAVARRRHRGRTTWVWDVELTDDDDRLCAVSRVTIAVRPA